MSNSNTLTATVKSEWIKFRTVRSSILGVVVTFVLTIGLGALIATTLRGHFHEFSPLRRITFDPVAASLRGTLFAQFAVGVIGILFITSEYSSGSIRTTLAAVPQRTRLALSKLIVLVVSMLVVSEVAVFITFLLAQSIFSGVVPTASLSNGSVLQAVILAGVFLTLLSALGFALGLILRQSATCISVYTSLLLIVPIVMFLLPQSWQTSYTKYEPSALGEAMMSPTGAANSFGAGSATAILLAYVVVVLGVGIVLLHRRDA
jgi:ABC-2 type transport system permease protein